jgi:hypothetical protein
MMTRQQQLVCDHAAKLSRQNPGTRVVVTNCFGPFYSMQTDAETPIDPNLAYPGSWINGKYKPFSENQINRAHELSNRRADRF